MSNRWPGGLIRKTPVTPAGPLQNGAAPGMWTLAEASFWTKQGLWPTQGNTLAVEDVFSTYLYTGTGAAQTITNGINLSGQGGMVWSKARSSATGHNLFDTARGRDFTLYTNLSNGQFGPSSATQDLTSFNNNGFSLGTPFNSNVNSNTVTYASWTFREAPNFFDVVTYTGTGANRTIAHNLGVAPGMILVKRTDTTGDWQVYHRSNANTQYMVLNTDAAVATGATRWNSTTPTATEFSVGTDATVNASGGTYVAYLYAHVPGSDGIIQCGSFDVDGSGNATVNLGWEPQWVMMKTYETTGSWGMYDNMRGMPVGNTNVARLFANSTSAEGSSVDYNVSPTATGFTAKATGYGASGVNGFIYVAIRRGPMRTPTLGTSVFSPNLLVSAAEGTAVTTGFPVDLQYVRIPPSAAQNYFVDRLRGFSSTASNSGQTLITNASSAEASTPLTNSWGNTGFRASAIFSTNTVIYSSFRRAPGFMDEVCYTGNDQVNRAINHNLSVLPELIILKSRFISGWFVYSPLLQAGRELFLDQDGGQFTYSTNFASSLNSATVFGIAPSAGTAANVNVNGINYVAYLFASCPGVSKVGSYTGNGSSQTINCAFTTGARFVLIKRTDSTGDWYVWDSARGIVAGNDPYLALNTTAAQVTSNDSVDTDSTGFVVNQVSASNINVNAATYIFLAIA